MKEIFFQLFCFMDIILRLHKYPENMCSVPSLKMQKIRSPGKLITIKGKKLKIEKKGLANSDSLSAFLSWVFQLFDTFSACKVTLICKVKQIFRLALLTSVIPKPFVRECSLKTRNTQNALSFKHWDGDSLIHSFIRSSNICILLGRFD